MVTDKPREKTHPDTTMNIAQILAPTAQTPTQKPPSGRSGGDSGNSGSGSFAEHSAAKDLTGPAKEPEGTAPAATPTMPRDFKTLPDLAQRAFAPAPDAAPAKVPDTAVGNLVAYIGEVTGIKDWSRIEPANLRALIDKARAEAIPAAQPEPAQSAAPLAKPLVADGQAALNPTLVAEIRPNPETSPASPEADVAPRIAKGDLAALPAEAKGHNAPVDAGAAAARQTTAPPMIAPDPAMPATQAKTAAPEPIEELQARVNTSLPTRTDPPVATGRDPVIAAGSRPEAEPNLVQGIKTLAPAVAEVPTPRPETTQPSAPPTAAAIVTSPGLAPIAAVAEAPKAPLTDMPPPARSGAEPNLAAMRGAYADIPVAKPATAAPPDPARAAPVALASPPPVEDQAPLPERIMAAAPERTPIAPNRTDAAGMAAPVAANATVQGQMPLQMAALGGDPLPLPSADPADIQFNDLRAAMRSADGAAPTQNHGAAPRIAAQAMAVSQQLAATLQKTSGGGFEIRLDPPELGRVSMQITATETGHTAIVASERAEVLDLLRRHESILSREMDLAGFADLTFQFSDQGGSPEDQPDQATGFARTDDAGDDPGRAAGGNLADSSVIDMERLDIRL